MKNYLETIAAVYLNGNLYPDRTGTGRVRVFGGSETFDLAKGLPIVTTRKIYLNKLIQELFGFIKGSNKISDLGETFWKAWSPSKEDIEEEIERIKKDSLSTSDTENIKMAHDEKHIEIIRNYLSSKVGIIGPMYGVLWRKFPRVNPGTKLDWFLGIDDLPSDAIPGLKEDFMKSVMLSQGSLENNQENWEKFAISEYFRTIDQLNMVYLNLKRNPYSSRHRVTAFHPDLIGSEKLSPKQNVLAGTAALAPCHTFFQFMVTDEETTDGSKKVLNCMFYMSSSDVMLGRPYNIAQYALLTMVMAHCLDYKPGKLTIVSCDTHIYADHLNQATEQLKREPLELATLSLPENKKDFFSFTAADIKINNYTSHPPVMLPAAV